MARTDSTAVQGILSSNHNYDGTTDLTPFIDTANNVVTQLATLASSNGRTLADATLELIERWLSAYYYCIMDPLYVSKSTGGASGSWDPRSYRKPAEDLDSSGFLKSILDGVRTQIFWAGKRPSQQTDYVDRD